MNRLMNWLLNPTAASLAPVYVPSWTGLPNEPQAIARRVTELNTLHEQAVPERVPTLATPQPRAEACCESNVKARARGSLDPWSARSHTRANPRASSMKETAP